jgi:hypothetical protein
MCAPDLSGSLDRAAMLELADALGDTLATFMAVHQLRMGLADAWVAGKPSDFAAAVVQQRALRAEPAGFGEDAALLWRILENVSGWTCVNVDTAVSRPLGALIEEGLGRPVRYYGDVYLALEGRPPEVENAAVRRLTLSDMDLIRDMPPLLQLVGFGTAERLLEDGFAAGAVVHGLIVSTAFTTARTPTYVDIGVNTLEQHRRRGFASAAAAVVCRLAIAAGLTPVWSAGEGNEASLKCAARLGFKEAFRREYIIVE